MKDKTKQFLSYVGKAHSFVTITSIMKLSYLVDLIAVTEGQKQISDFEYERYLFGPFDRKIYEYINELVEEGIFIEKSDYSPRGDEYIVYEFNNENDNITFEKLNPKENKIMDEVLEELQGLGSRVLSKIAYDTKPMKKIGAELGNDKGLHEPLDLSA